MAELIQMIQLSPTMEEGLLVEWLKSEGDTVSVGDLIAEIETDKASMEMESFYDGVILKILVEEGASVSVGKPLAVIGEEGEDISDLLAELEAGGASGRSAPARDEEGADAPPPASESSERPSPASLAPAESSDATTSSEDAAPRLQPRDDGRVLSSPLARRIAGEHDLPIAKIDGSGPGGRVIKRDVEAALREGLPTRASAAARSQAPTARALPGDQAASTLERLSPMRRAIARNTTAAWEIPAFMLTRTIRMDAALELRREVNARLEAREGGGKISVNDLVLKACALALRDEPAVHAAFEDEQLRRFHRSRIGVAVAIDDGLITPIVEDAEYKGLAQIAAEVRDLAGRARDKKLSPEEYSGSTFSVSNLGMFGIDHFTAVLNPPGAAILAVGASKTVLVAADDERGFTHETQMSVTLTCDHRVIDGAVGARWLQHFAGYLESPLTMLL